MINVEFKVYTIIYGQSDNQLCKFSGPTQKLVVQTWKSDCGRNTVA